MKIAERGSLELHRTLSGYNVHFAEWFEHRGFGSLEAVDDFHEIYSNTAGTEVRLNGSQAQTVRAWRQHYG